MNIRMIMEPVQYEPRIMSSVNRRIAHCFRITATLLCLLIMILFGDIAAGSTVLFILPDPANPSGDDVDKIALIETWGFSVTRIADSAGQAEVDLAIESAEVAYISTSASAASLGSKLTGAVIGVVSENGGMNAALGIATGSTTFSDRRIEILDNTHHITSPLDLGNLFVGLFFKIDMNGTSGTLAAGAEVLAKQRNKSTPSLVVIESGGTLVSGGKAAGRRVLSPFYGNPNLLLPNGQVIIRRAIEWAMSSPSSGPQEATVLFVVPDPANPSAQDSRKQQIMEASDMTVSMMAASASQADYDAAVALADVVYISEEISAAQLNTKLRDAAIGVVYEEAQLNDKFALTTGYVNYDERRIDITDNTHYITELFDAKQLWIAWPATSLNLSSGTTAGGARVLAEERSGNGPALLVADTGDMLLGGLPAPDRRVMLPFGGNNFDINVLTDSGQVIMVRAIEWAAHKDSMRPTIVRWQEVPAVP